MTTALPWGKFDATTVEARQYENTLIPAKTKLPLIIIDIKEDEYEGEPFISIETVVADNPTGFANKHHWTKLKFLSKPDSARERLAEIVKAAGLVEEFKANFSMETMELLKDKIIVGEFAIWKGDSGEGNWIRSFSQYGAQAQTAASPVAAAAGGKPW